VIRIQFLSKLGAFIAHYTVYHISDTHLDSTVYIHLKKKMGTYAEKSLSVPHIIPDSKVQKTRKVHLLDQEDQNLLYFTQLVCKPVVFMCMIWRYVTGICVYNTYVKTAELGDGGKATRGRTPLDRTYRKATAQ
jgi:hypothetical protein